MPGTCEKSCATSLALNLSIAPLKLYFTLKTLLLHFRRSSAPCSLLDPRPVISLFLHLPCRSAESCLLSLPLNLIFPFCFTFPAPAFQAESFLSHGVHPGILPRIRFACVFTSELAGIFQNNLSAWSLPGLVLCYNVGYLVKIPPNGRYHRFYHRQTEFISLFPPDLSS